MPSRRIHQVHIDLKIDWGITFGLAGLAVALLSLVYARTQAVHAQRQADAAQLAATLDLQRAMADRIYRTSMDLVSKPDIMTLYLQANPSIREVYPDAATFESALVVFNLIEGLQDMYFLRKSSIVEDHHWRTWMGAFAPVARMPITRKIYDNAVTRELIDPEFAIFLRPIFDGRSLTDPKGQIAP